MLATFGGSVRNAATCALVLGLSACTSSPEADLPGFVPTASPASGQDAGDTGALPTQPTGSEAGSVGVSPSAADAGSAVDAEPASSDATFVPNQEDEYLGLPAPKSGFRMKNVGVDVLPDSDVELCEVAELPGTPDQEYIVQAVELANGRGSHHLVIGAALPDSDADKKLRSMKVGDRLPCYSTGAEFGLGTFTLTFTQSPYRKADMPDGIGKRMRGGQRIIFDYHYFNFGSQTIKAKSALAFHLLPADKLKNIAEELAFSNFTIDTPPNQAKLFKASCKLKHDVLLMNLVRHTHSKSNEFDVWYEGGPDHGKLVWSSKDWEHDTEHRFPQPILMKAGQGFKWSCGFTNPSNKNLRMGTSASDEMCILNGTMWSPTVGAEPPDASCTTTWIDAEGVSHAADDYGGVPKPSFDEELACHVSTVGTALLSSCVGCICGSCGGPFTRCQNDPDCKALLECTSANKGPCTPEFMEHSSAVGMITAVGTCIQNTCPKECAAAPAADAGTAQAGDAGVR
jgi:hypothetical protein